MAPTLKIALSQIRHSPRRYVSVLIAIVIAVNALAWTARRAGERLAG